MASSITTELEMLQQRSGAATSRLGTEAEKAAFRDSLKRDIAELMYQHNKVVYPVLSKLSALSGADALDKGIAGNSVYTDIDATAASADAYWSTDQVRARTIKETIDVLLSEIARLENELQSAIDEDAYDDAVVRGLIATNVNNLTQLAVDTMGPGYTLDDDGNPDLSYPLSQAIDAIGAFFGGFPGSGNAGYTNTYPTLSLTVNLSDVVIDTTVPQSTVDGLTDDLGYIRAFMGMDTTGPELPTYSTWGTLSYLTDSWSLERAVAELDVALAAVSASAGGTLQAAYDAGAAGTHQPIQLANASGHIRVLDDAGSPLGTMQDWYATSGLVATVKDSGIQLEAEKSLDLVVSPSAPAAAASTGRIYSAADSASGSVEAFYRNDQGADTEAQITRDGIVKELEVGNDVLRAADLKKFVLAAGPTLEQYEYTDMVVEARMFDQNSVERAYGQFAIPRDENGNQPSRVRIIGHFVLGTPGTYPGGSGIAFGLQLSDSVQYSTVATKTTIDPGWQPGVLAVENLLSAANQDNLIVLEWPVIDLALNDLGLLNVRLSRIVTDPNDNWADDVGCIALQAVWLR